MGGYARTVKSRTWWLRALACLVAATVVVAPAPPAAYAAACGPSINSPLPDQPWPQRRLRPDLVWPLTRGAGIVVAVIDSGVSDAHPALSGQVLAGQDLSAPGGDGRCDTVGHGTIIAGIIAGKETPQSGFHGMAPDARILPIRVIATDQRSFDKELPFRIAQAIRIAADSGAKVINLSLTTDNVPELEQAVAYAVSKNVVVVAATGNEGQSQQNEGDVYPAAYPGVIGVAGVDEDGNHVSTSPEGDYVDIAAPGAQIAGPAPQGGGYAFLPAGGTSFACAYVSGLAALVRAYRPELSAADVAKRIIRTADQPPGGRDKDVGFGVVNPYWAVVSVTGEAGRPQLTGTLSVPPPGNDTGRTIRIVAAWAAFVAVVGSGLVVASVSVLRRGRRRGWRPGT
jgi:membrane-anchored mycosin MYCP